MTDATFYRWLAVTAGLTGLGAALLHAVMPIDYAVPLTVGLILLLIGICVGLFYGGKWAANHESKFMFNNVFLGGTLVKMFVWGGILAAYIILAVAPNKWFVLPAFLGYACFTLFEIVFLMKLARGEERRPPADA